MEIVEAIFNGHRVPTRIMHAVNMSYTPLKMHLKVLVERDLVAESLNNESDKRTRCHYDITEKGQELVFAYRALLKIWQQ